MTTLKIQNLTRTIYIQDVTEIDVDHCFEFSRSKHGGEVIPQAFGDIGLTAPGSLNVMGFGDEPCGKVLYVRIWGVGPPQIWVVPEKCCFLLSDSGKTIDRF